MNMEMRPNAAVKELAVFTKHETSGWKRENERCQGWTLLGTPAMNAHTAAGV